MLLEELPNPKFPFRRRPTIRITRTLPSVFGMTLLVGGLFLGPLAESSLAPNVLIFGDSEKSNLAANLTALGDTVTVVTILPLDLTPFDKVWHVGALVPLTPAERARLAAFLASGKGVHLTGERPCCEALNNSLELLVNSVVVAGGINVGDQGDILPGPYPFNPTAVGGITTTPNALTSWCPISPGGIGGVNGVSGPNVLVSRFDGVPVGAAWDSTDLVGGTGRLTLLMDVNWFTQACGPPIIENIENFLQNDAGEPFRKEITSGSDVDNDGGIDLVVEVGQSSPIEYGFDITYSNLGGPDVLIVDTVPAEWVVTMIEGMSVDVDACGESDSVSDGFGSVDVFKGGKVGKNCKSATHIEWTPDPKVTESTLEVDVETRLNPGHGKRQIQFFAPTSCGPLFLNDGALVFEVNQFDQILTPSNPLFTSNALCLAAVEDLSNGNLGNPGGPDGLIARDGTGDEDLDGLTDFAEACDIGTDPCLADTDGDGVNDDPDLCPLRGLKETGSVDADGCPIGP